MGLIRYKTGRYRTRKGVLTKKAAVLYKSMRLSTSRGLSKNNLYNVKHFKVTRYQQNAFNVGGDATAASQLTIGMNFSLADASLSATGGTFGIANASEFAVLFDAFKLNKVVVCFEPQGNVYQFGAADSSVATTSDTPGIHSSIDFNSSAVPTSINDLVQYNTYKRTRGMKTHKRVFTPRFQLTSQLAGSSVNVLEGQKKWIDTNTAANTPSTLPHYGLRLMSDSVQTANRYYWDLRITYYFSMKDNN